MTKKKELTRESFDRFNKLRFSFEKIGRLMKSTTFVPDSNAEKELERFNNLCPLKKKDSYNKYCEDSEVYDRKICKTEEQIFYNKFLRDADSFYQELLNLARIIAPYCGRQGWTKEEFENMFHNIGVIKNDIDDIRVLDGVVIDDTKNKTLFGDELKKFLFGLN